MTKLGGIQKPTNTEAYEAEDARMQAVKAEREREERAARLAAYAKPRNRQERRAHEAKLRAYNATCSRALVEHGSRTLLNASPEDVISFAESAASLNAARARAARREAARARRK